MKIRILGLLAMASVLLSFVACSGSMSRPSERQLQAAALGRRHAAMLCATSSDDMSKMQYRILSVRSKEWQFRSLGLNAEADSYIGAFSSSLRSMNEELSNKILGDSIKCD